MCGVPLGVTAVCQAGVSLTQPQSNLTVPPMLGSKTCSTPLEPISLASSTMATTGQPARLAMSTVSPRWSACPWVSRIALGLSSSACAAALGLPVRNGSISTLVPPSDSSKQAWPKKRMSMCSALLVLEFVRQREADGHADQHAQPRLLRDERAHAPRALGLVGLGDGPRDLCVVGVPEEPALVQRLVEDALQRRRGVGDDLLRVLEATRLAEPGHRGVDLVGGVGAVVGHGRAGRYPRDCGSDLVVARRRLRLQAAAGRGARARRAAA